MQIVSKETIYVFIQLIHHEYDVIQTKAVLNTVSFS